MTMQRDRHTALAQEADVWRDWLFGAAMPLWTGPGRDPATGAFVEAIGLDGVALVERPRRGRVQPRQIYATIEAGRLGWSGPWRTAAAEALDWYLAAFPLADGTFADLVAADGQVLSPRFDLYNQAFALFALAHAARAFPERAEALEARAAAVLATLAGRFRHPTSGFEESDPPSLPLRANPHMHLLEAALAWEDAGGGDQWRALADEIMELALARLIDGPTGALREFFAADWRPMADASGGQVEPGHQFEWAWLALRWARARGRADAAVAARRLHAIGAGFGLCAARGAAVLEIEADFTPRAPVARLWAQTEWLKSALLLADWSAGIERDHYLDSALAASRALRAYVEGVPAGLWRDRWEADGRFVEEPAPASSLYHIVCGLSELITRFGTRAQ